MDQAYGDKLKRTFKWSVLQSVNQVFLFLADRGISIEEFNAWVEKELDARFNKVDLLLKVERRCPECDAPLTINPVNTSKRNRIEGNWSSMWFCDNCGWNEMSTVEARAESQKYLVPINNAEIEDLMGREDERVRRHIRRRPSIRAKTIQQ